jgi:hypothetical protein
LFLVDSLKQLHLLGTGFQPEYSVVVDLIELTCIGDMLQQPVIVFRDSPFPDGHCKCDLLASPEDIADTWGPARFIADPKQSQSRKIYAIEIGGGTISRVGADARMLHWSPGAPSIPSLTFDARQKSAVGGVHVNEK